MHIVEEGSGPLVIFCHGFPECWYSWRYQLSTLAHAGFRAIAPDQRGYGHTDCPDAVKAYDMFQLVGDIVGLVDVLGEKQALIIGHDWGASVAIYCALLRPDIFRAIVIMSIPYRPRLWKDIRPTDAMKLRAGDQQFYQLYFQEQGKAEAEFEDDVKKTMRMFLYPMSGDATQRSAGGLFLTKRRRYLTRSMNRMCYRSGWRRKTSITLPRNSSEPVFGED